MNRTQPYKKTFDISRPNSEIIQIIRSLRINSISNIIYLFISSLSFSPCSSKNTFFIRKEGTTMA